MRTRAGNVQNKKALFACLWTQVKFVSISPTNGQICLNEVQLICSGRTWHLKWADSPGYFVWFIIVFWIWGGPHVSTEKRNLSENHKSLDILEEPVLTLTRKVWKKSKLGHKYLNVTYFSTLFRRDSDVTAPQIPSVREGLCTQGFLTEEETSLVSPDRPAEEDRVTGH